MRAQKMWFNYVYVAGMYIFQKYTGGGMIFGEMKNWSTKGNFFHTYWYFFPRNFPLNIIYFPQFSKKKYTKGGERKE